MWVTENKRNISQVGKVTLFKLRIDKPLRTHHCKGEEMRNLQSEPTKSNINFHKTLPFDLVSFAFLCYFLFWEERDIKFEQKYLFTHDFNKCDLRKTNGTYFKLVKLYFLNYG